MSSHQVRCAEFCVWVCMKQVDCRQVLRFSLRQSKTRTNTEQASTMTTSPQCHMIPFHAHQTRSRSYTDVTCCAGRAVRPIVAVISSDKRLFFHALRVHLGFRLFVVVCVCVFRCDCCERQPGDRVRTESCWKRPLMSDRFAVWRESYKWTRFVMLGHSRMSGRAAQIHGHILFD